MTQDRTRPLRTIIALDALVGFVHAVIILLASTPIATYTALPRSLLLAAGMSLVPIAAFLGFVAWRASDSQAAVTTVIVGNVAWSLASFVLLLGETVSMNGLGAAFLVVQALVVLLFASLETWAAWPSFARTGLWSRRPAHVGSPGPESLGSDV